MTARHLLRVFSIFLLGSGLLATTPLRSESDLTNRAIALVAAHNDQSLDHVKAGLQKLTHSNAAEKLVVALESPENEQLKVLFYAIVARPYFSGRAINPLRLSHLKDAVMHPQSGLSGELRSTLVAVSDDMNAQPSQSWWQRNRIKALITAAASLTGGALATIALTRYLQSRGTPTTNPLSTPLATDKPARNDRKSRQSRDKDPATDTDSGLDEDDFILDGNFGSSDFDVSESDNDRDDKPQFPLRSIKRRHSISDKSSKEKPLQRPRSGSAGNSDLLSVPARGTLKPFGAVHTDATIDEPETTVEAPEDLNQQFLDALEKAKGTITAERFSLAKAQANFPLETRTPLARMATVFPQYLTNVQTDDREAVVAHFIQVYKAAEERDLFAKFDAITEPSERKNTLDDAKADFRGCSLAHLLARAPAYLQTIVPDDLNKARDFFKQKYATLRKKS